MFCYKSFMSQFFLSLLQSSKPKWHITHVLWKRQCKKGMISAIACDSNTLHPLSPISRGR